MTIKTKQIRRDLEDMIERSLDQFEKHLEGRDQEELERASKASIVEDFIDGFHVSVQLATILSLTAMEERHDFSSFMESLMDIVKNSEHFSLDVIVSFIIQSRYLSGQIQPFKGWNKEEVQDVFINFLNALNPSYSDLDET